MTGLTRPACILEFVMRKTLLPRPGYREGSTRIQQWLVAHLVAHREFDIWDLIVLDVEDTIAKGIHRSSSVALCALVDLFDSSGLCRSSPTSYSQRADRYSDSISTL